MIIIFIAYVLLSMFLALVVMKKNKTVHDMLVAKNGLSVILIVPLLMSEAVGGSGTVGSATEAMSTIGMAAVWTIWGIAIGYFCFRLFFGKFYRVLSVTRGIISVPSAYEARFDKRTKIVLLIVVCVVYACLFALQPVAAAAVLAPMFGVDRATMIIVLGILFIIIACLGGLKGMASMNRLHAFVMVVGLGIVAFSAVNYGGGWKAVLAELPENYMNPFNPGMGQVLVWVLSGLLSQMSSAVIATVIIGGKTYNDVKHGVNITCVLLFIFALFPVIIGIAAKAVMPDIDPATALYSMSAQVSPVIGGIAVVAVLAAIFSTAPALLLIVTTTVIQDLYKSFVKPTATDKETMAMSRIVTVVVGLLAVFMATKTTSIFKQTVQIFQIRAIAAVVLLLSLAWPRVDSRAGFWGILSGGTVAVVWYFMENPPLVSDPLIPSLIVGVIVTLVLTLCSKKKVSDGYQYYLELQEEYKSLKNQT